MAKTLMLKGLPLGIGIRKVFEACRQYGQISQVVVNRAGVWEEPASVALVEFNHQQDAETARTALANRLIGNSRVYVE